MDIKIIHGSRFYADDATRELSKKYDVKSYNAPFHTLGEGCTEFALGRLFFLSRIAGEVVGVDMETYRKDFPGQKWYDSSSNVFDGEDLERYAGFAEKKIKAAALRKERADKNIIYFPTEALATTMLKGTRFIPFNQYWASQRIH